jgi:hypothetical protein
MKAPNRPSDFFDRTKIPPLFRADSAARIWLGNSLSISGDDVAKGRSALYPPSIGAVGSFTLSSINRHQQETTSQLELNDKKLMSGETQSDSCLSATY